MNLRPLGYEPHAYFFKTKEVAVLSKAYSQGEIPYAAQFATPLPIDPAKDPAKVKKLRNLNSETQTDRVKPTRRAKAVTLFWIVSSSTEPSPSSVLAISEYDFPSNRRAVQRASRS